MLKLPTPAFENQIGGFLVNIFAKTTNFTINDNLNKSSRIDKLLCFIKQQPTISLYKLQKYCYLNTINFGELCKNKEISMTKGKIFL